jgi:hypothetical protein
MVTRKSILTIDKIVFVNLDEGWAPVAHGFTSITYDHDRIPEPRGFGGRGLVVLR